MGALDQTIMRPVNLPSQVKIVVCWQLFSENTHQGREEAGLEDRGCPSLQVGPIRRDPEPLLGLSSGLSKSSAVNEADVWNSHPLLKLSKGSLVFWENESDS